MKAAVLRKPYELVVEDVPRPLVRPGYVVVEVKATAVCGTDVGIYTGKSVIPLPVIQGHESTGLVVEIGPEVTELAVGDRVVLNSAVFCRHCPDCYTGRTNLCPNGGLMGRELDGTFAQFVAVPDYSCIKIPPSLGYEDGTSLITLATVFRSHDKIRLAPGNTVAVIGLGAAGLLQTRLSVISGADPVFAVGRSKWKLEIAQQWGARSIDASRLDPVSAVKEATCGQGVDVAIECVGSGTTLRQAMEMVRPGGTVLFFGIAPPSLPDFNGYAMYYKELTLVGSRGMTPADFHAGIKVVAAGRVDLGRLVTHRFHLDRVKEAMDLVATKGGQTLRVVVSI